MSKIMYVIAFIVFFANNANSQTTIFSCNFDSYSTGELTTSGFNGWKKYESSGSVHDWEIYNLSGAPSSPNCLTLNDSYGNHGDYAWDDAGNEIAYYGTLINASAYINLKLNFKWKCYGESGYDYGKVVWSTNGTTWNQLSPVYNLQTAWQTVTDLDLSVVNNTQFYIGFQFINDGADGAVPSFSIDDITIKGCSPPSNSISGTTTICNGNSTTLTCNGTGTSWLWNTGATTQAITVSPATTTTYTVTATLSSCTSSANTTVTVNSVPTISAHPANKSQSPCGSTSFSVTASGGALSYNWQVNTGSGWSDITAAGSNPTYANWTTSTLGLSGIGANNGYQYRCYVSNSCGNVTSNAATLTVGYGAPSISGGCGGRWISNFDFAGISNPGTGCAASPYYTYYSGMTATVAPGNGYPVTIGSSDASTYYKVWIDFNDNYSFEDSGELVYGVVGPANATSGTLTIPGGAATGTHRLRVRTCDASSFTSCSAQTYGETEDYNVKVCVFPSISVQPANANICGTSTSFSVTASNVTSYQWQVSTNGGSTWSNITTAGSSPTYANWTTATLNLTGIALVNNGYYYRCVLSNSCTTINTNVAELTAHATPVVTLQPTNQTTTDGGSATFTGNATGNGLSVQWQVSTNGGSTWTNISNGSIYSGVTTGTLNILNATGLNGYQYHAVITNSCGSVTTNAATLTVNICTPSNSACGSRYIWIFNYGGINKTTSTTCTGSPSYYNSYSDTAIVAQGVSTPISIAPGTTDASTYFKIWIDFNNNNSFEDAGEKVAEFGPGNQVSSNITINGAEGFHRLRVRSSNSGSMTSCNTQTQGETEDYNIKVVPCTPTTQASNVTFLNVYNTRFDVTWTNGSGLGRAAFIALSSASANSPSNGSTYTANTVYGLGTQIGTSGWYCIYNGTGGGPITVTGLSPNTSYKVKVFEYNNMCSSSPRYNTSDNTNNPKSQTTANIALCTPTSIKYEEYISNVDLNTLSNASDSTSPYNGYSNYTSTVAPTDLKQGVTYTAIITNGMPYYNNDQCGLWIDYNQDQDFNDPDEAILVNGSPGTGPYTAVINPPLSSLLGPTTMRVRIRTTGPLNPCDTTLLGETEDYKINIISGTPCNPMVFQDACETSAGWTLQEQSGTYRNKWAVSTCNAIDPSNKSLTVISSTDNGANYVCSYGYTENPTSNTVITAYKTVNASAYNSLKLNFKWKCVGNSSDYGKVVYSTNGGSTWTPILTNLYNSASPTTVTNQALTGLDNTTFLLGFQWVQNTVTKADPPFTVDDIYILGDCGSPNPAAADTIHGSHQVCAGQQGVMYSVAPISNATTYVWNYTGTGATISGNSNNVSINFASNATSGTLTVRGFNGSTYGTVSSGYSITVNHVPTAPVSYTQGDNSVCQGQTATYAVSAVSGATSYAWNVPTGYNIVSGMGTSTVSINFSTQAVSSDIYVAGVNLCDTGAYSTAYHVNVIALPSPAGTISGPDTVCKTGGTWVYTVPPISGADGYAWTLPTGATITSGNNTNSVTVNFASTVDPFGQISVAGLNNANCSGSSGYASPPFSVTIGYPPPSAGTINGPTAVCQNTGGYIYSITGSTLASSYVWTVPSGATITSGNNTSQITVSYGAGAVSGNVTVHMSNLCGSGATSTLAVTVTSTVAAAGAITGTASVCQGQTGVTYSISAISGASSYVWSLPNGATITAGGGTSITVSFSSSAVSGNVSVYGTNACFDGAASNLAVTVNEASVIPTIAYASPSIISVGMASTLSFAGGSLGAGATWEWYSGSCGGTHVGTGTTITVSPTSSTVYYVRAEGDPPCGNTSCVSVNVTVSTDPLYNGIFNCGANIHVFPNTYFYIDGNTNGDYSTSSTCGPNGYIDIDGVVYVEGDWYDNNNNNSFPKNALENISDNDGYVHLIGSVNTQYIGGVSETTFENVVINNTTSSSGDNVNLLINTNVNGTLNLIDGVIKTSDKKITIENTSSSAIILNGPSVPPGNGNSFIDGNLKRKMASGSGSYYFPLGYGGHTPDNYYLISVENKTLAWSANSYIDSKVEAMIRHTDPDLVTANVIELGTAYNSMATEAMWTLTPTIQPTGGKYDLKCWITNIKNESPLADNSFAILKRPDNSTGLSWNKGGGTLNANGGAGRMLSDDYALRKDLDNSLGSYFSEIGIAKSKGPLPVELLSFNAYCRDMKVAIKWSTASEINSDFFTVERSKDAFLWEPLTTVTAAGNSNSISNYTVEDNEPLAEQSYYRLNQTDFDGSVETFPTASVICDGNEGMQLINVVSEAEGTNVFFTTPNEDKYIIYLYDDRGNLISEKNDFSMNGFNQVTLNTSSLSRGIYLLVLTDNKDLFTRKIIIN